MDNIDIHEKLIDIMVAVGRLEEMMKSALATHSEFNQRMLRVEDFCEEKRRRIAALEPVKDAVFGTGPHYPGLVSRTSALERLSQIDSTGPTILMRVDDMTERVGTLENNTITRGYVARIAALSAALVSSAAAIAHFFYRGP